MSGAKTAAAAAKVSFWLPEIGTSKQAMWFMRLGGATGSAAVREPFETRGATDEDPVQVVKDGEL